MYANDPSNGALKLSGRGEAIGSQVVAALFGLKSKRLGLVEGGEALGGCLMPALALTPPVAAP